LEHVFGMNWGW